MDNREGIPIAHYADALIIYGGKTYTKKTPIRNGDRELVKDGAMREIFPPSAATANGTTNHRTPVSFQLVDNKGGVSPTANVGTNSPSESIPQEERDSKPNTASDEEYLQAVNDFKNAKTDEQRRSTFHKLQDMVQRWAEVAGFTNTIPEQTVAFVNGALF